GTWVVWDCEPVRPILHYQARRFRHRPCVEPPDRRSPRRRANAGESNGSAWVPGQLKVATLTGCGARCDHSSLSITCVREKTHALHQTTVYESAWPRTGWSAGSGGGYLEGRFKQALHARAVSRTRSSRAESGVDSFGAVSRRADPANDPQRDGGADRNRRRRGRLAAVRRTRRRGGNQA